ncbi:hypothetical protein ABZ714_30565 [Streptomyces sp. NPDC006798]|uniref:hypothetical protein n=1 Tax=Streptomyces sp. NPDC006798 TaxID=3155462 RepID=UPI0033C9B46E
MADSRALGRAWPHADRAEEYGPRVAGLGMDVAYFAGLCDPVGAGRWAEADPDRTENAEAAVGLLDRWAGLPAAWRAAVLREAHYGARTRGRLAFGEAVALAAAYAGKGAPPPMPGYAELRGVDAPELARRILRLPLDWRVEAFRRIAAGADPVIVEADARRAIRTTVT